MPKSLQERISELDIKYNYAKAQRNIEQLALHARPLWVHIIIMFSTILLVATQGLLMNLFYINHYDSIFTYMWFVADVASILVFVGALIVANNYLRHPHKRIRRKILDLPDKTIWHPGVLPLSYISWLFYSVVVVTKILMLIEGEVVFHLRYQEALFGSVLMQGAVLQIAISLSGVVFHLIVEGHCTAPRSSWRYNLEVNDSALVALEVLDSANLIYVLACYKVYDWMKIDVTPEIVRPIEFICVTTFVLPCLFLYQLTLTDVQSELMVNVFDTVYDILHIVLIDIPNIGIRIYLWVMHDFYSSLYLMRNLFSAYGILRRALPNIAEMIVVCRFTSENPRYSNVESYKKMYKMQSQIDFFKKGKPRTPSSSTIGPSPTSSLSITPSQHSPRSPSLSSISLDTQEQRKKSSVTFLEPRVHRNKSKYVRRKTVNEDEQSKQTNNKTRRNEQTNKSMKEQPEKTRKELTEKTRKEKAEKMRNQLPDKTKKEQIEKTRNVQQEKTRKDEAEKKRRSRRRN